MPSPILPFSQIPFDDIPWWWVAKKLKIYLRPDQPYIENISLHSVRYGTMLFYRVDLSPTLDADAVVRRELTCTVNSNAPYTVNVVSGDEIQFPAAVQVTATLRDFDEAGNGSLPSEPFSFMTTEVDVTPPTKPTIVGFAYLRTEPDA